MEDSRCGSQFQAGNVIVESSCTEQEPLSPSESRKIQSMAFTIHFAENKDAAAAKKLSDNFNRYLGHRRNPSLPIMESAKDVKTTVNAVRAVGLSPLMVRKCVATNRRAGYHSEGYFSSDQEEDAKARSDFFVKKFRNLEKGLRATNLAQEKKIMSGQNGMPHTNDLSPTENGDEFGDFIEDRISPEPLSETKRHNVSVCSKEDWVGSDGEEAVSNDTASEAGTYTIDRDTPCPEVIHARLEVEKAVAVSSISRVETAEKDKPQENGGQNFKMSMYRDGSNWINEWASHVAKQNHETVFEKKKPASLPPLPLGNRYIGTNNSLLTRIPSPVQSPNMTPTAERKVHPSPQHVRNCQSPLLNNSVSHNSFLASGMNFESETESFLRTTESVVTAMQARMSSLSVDSGGESDVDTSHSYPASIGRGVRRGSVPRSDSSSDAERRKDLGPKAPSPAPAPPPLMRYNRAFSLRRARLDCETEMPPPPPPAAQPPVSNATNNRCKKTNNEIVAPPRCSTKKNTEVVKNSVPKNLNSKSPKVERSPFSRTDCGRFSVRTPKVTPQAVPKTNSLRKDGKKGSPGGRSNSTLSSREVEFQNWKRRKSYDPMKAAAEGKKKEAAKKATMTTSMTQSSIVSSDISPSQQNPVLRSASFHGTGGLTPNYISSEDEVTLSADEDSPISAYPPSLATASPTKMAIEGMFGNNNKSCLYNSPSSSSLRGRNKMEALDSLVMAAVCGISNKLRGTSSTLLKKLRFLYEGDTERYDKLTAVIELLENSPCGSPQNKSPSKELSGTLKNLKRLENVIKVLDEVLFDEDDLEIELEEY